jgi:hypothetical protein
MNFDGQYIYLFDEDGKRVEVRDDKGEQITVERWTEGGWMETSTFSEYQKDHVRRFIQTPFGRR